MYLTLYDSSQVLHSITYIFKHYFINYSLRLYDNDHAKFFNEVLVKNCFSLCRSSAKNYIQYLYIIGIYRMPN